MGGIKVKNLFLLLSQIGQWYKIGMKSSHLLRAVAAGLLLGGCASALTESQPHGILKTPVQNQAKEKPAKNFLGTQTYVNGNQEDLDAFNQGVDISADMGMKYLRLDAKWEKLEVNGVINSDEMHKYIQRKKYIESRGMKPIFVMTTFHGQHLATGKYGFPSIPADQTAYARFVAAFAKAMGPDTMVELGNEVNLGVKEPEQVGYYANMVKTVSKELSAQNVKAITLGPAVSTWQDGNPDHISALNFMQLAKDQGAKFDLYTIHLYNGVGRPEDLVPKLLGAKKIAGDAGLAVTESGWSSDAGPNGVGEIEQSRRDLKLVGLVHDTGVVKFQIVYEALEHTPNWCNDRKTGKLLPGLPDQGFVHLIPSEQHFGLARQPADLKSPVQLKPAGEAIKKYIFSP